MIHRFQVRGRVYEVSVEHSPDGLCAWIDGRPHEVEILDVQTGMISIRFAGRPVTAHWAVDGRRKWISAKGCTYLFEKTSSSARGAAGRSAENTLRAPMPAQVRSVEVADGDQVEKGQTLMLLEAMKMEIRVQATKNGRIAGLKVAPGQTVNRDQALLEIE